MTTTVPKSGAAPTLKGEESAADRPRIGYLLGTFPNLTETFVLREIDTLRERGFDVRVFAMKRPDHPEVERSLLTTEWKGATYARPDNVGSHLWANLKALLRNPLRYLRSLSVFLGEVPRVEPGQSIRAIFHFFTGIGFVGEFRRQGIDHLHAHFRTGCDIALAANLFAGMSFSFTAHATGDIYWRPILLKEKVERASFVIAVCEYSRRYLDAFTRFEHSGKLHTIYNGIDVAEPEVMLGSLGESVKEGVDRIEKSMPRIVSVGSLDPVKGFSDLIRACELLRDAGHSFECEIVGEGPDREMLELMIREADLDNRVRLKGAKSLRGVYESLAGADVFVLLSAIDANGRRDGFPTVILEAMVMGLPVVSTWLSGISEMVEDGVSGFLVSERNPEAAYRAIAELFVGDHVRKTMGEAGRKRVRDRFDSADSADLRARLFATLTNMVEFLSESEATR